MAASQAAADRSRFAELFQRGCRLLDVRAEVEFERGAFPAAINLPILTSSEREQVGICYQQQGQAAAIELGESLVSGEIRESRIASWCELARRHEDLHLYCWRGGLRSQLAQQWLAERGQVVPRISGGYKALRQFLMDAIDRGAGELKFLRIGGRTGSGKTALLLALDHGVDLEGHANHRGSSFGRRVSAPPGQVDFENALGIEMLQRRQARPGVPLFVEDESRRIGTVEIPSVLFAAMRDSAMAVVEMPIEQRIDNVLADYVIAMRAEYEHADPGHGFDNYCSHLLDSLIRIRRRLGDERYRRCEEVMRAALSQQQRDNDVDGHREWIRILLSDYYDRMYDYQLQQHAGQIVYRGDWQQVLDWAQAQIS